LSRGDHKPQGEQVVGLERKRREEEEAQLVLYPFRDERKSMALLKVVEKDSKAQLKPVENE
jgi:hypothetical protein